MLGRIFSSLKAKERTWRRSFGVDISTDYTRKRAEIHYRWFDHGILRVYWKNFHKLDTGVYRSNQPSSDRLAEFKAMGIKTVLNLRGAGGHSPYLFEKEACEKLGLTLVDHRIPAKWMPSREQLLTLISHMSGLEKPFVMHCKSGADRTGMAAVIYLNVIKGVPLEIAVKHLSMAYIHFKFTRHGILDYFFEAYKRDTQGRDLSLENWIENEYDPDVLAQEYLNSGQFLG